MRARFAARVLLLLAACWLCVTPAIAGTRAHATRSAHHHTTPRAAALADRDADATAEERESPPQRKEIGELEALGNAAVPPPFLPLGLATQGAGPAGLDWTFLGPQPMTGEYWSSNGEVAGRVNAVAVNPSNANIVYAAAAGGGVWKTTDAGTTWNVLTEGLPSITSGSIALDPTNANIVWYATGEANYCGDCLYGSGLFKSTDAGATWSQVATAGQVGSYVARIVRGGGTDTLYAGGSRGFVRSTDKGATWTVTQGYNWCDDVVASATQPSQVVCAIYGYGIYRSTDAGLTWTNMLLLPGRTNLARSPSNPNVVFASASTGPGNIYGFYKSSNGGQTWTTLPIPPDYLAGQGWYDNVVVVSPTDTATVFVGGVYPYNASSHGVMRSTDSGNSWTDVTAGVDGIKVHPDQHGMAFGPDGTLWLGNDGGVWKSTDLANHWLDCNHTLAVAQLYTVAAHPTNPSDLIAGTQDNGSIRYGGAVSWPLVVTGDGGPVMYRRQLPNYFYTSYVRMNPIYKWNSGSYVGSATGGWATSGVDRVDWANGPLVEDPQVDGTFYVGTQRAWKTTDSGTSWATISGDLTNGSGWLRSIAISPLNSNLLWTGATDGSLRRSRDGGVNWTAPLNLGSTVPTIVTSPTDTAFAYLCIDVSGGTRVVSTPDGGTSLANATGNLPTGIRAMCMAVDWRPAIPRLYVGTDYGVYASLDGGTTWVKASHYLPNVAVYQMVIDTTNNKLVAATHGRGMWRADLDLSGPAVTVTAPAGGEAWPLEANRTITWTATDPSTVASVDLKLSTDGGATYPTTIATGLPNTGSYSWKVLPSPSTTARIKVIGHDALGNVAGAASAANFSMTLTTAVEGSGVAFGLAPVAPNVGTGPFHVSFGLPAAAHAAVAIHDAAGRRVRALATGVFGAGPHALVWDGRDADGAFVAPGVYFVRLVADGREVTRRLALVR